MKAALGLEINLVVDDWEGNSNSKSKKCALTRTILSIAAFASTIKVVRAWIGGIMVMETVEIRRNPWYIRIYFHNIPKEQNECRRKRRKRWKRCKQNYWVPFQSYIYICTHTHIYLHIAASWKRQAKEKNQQHVIRIRVQSTLNAFLVFFCRCWK